MVILSGGAMNKLRNSIRVTAADGLSDYFVRLYKDFGIEDKFLAEIFGEIDGKNRLVYKIDGDSIKIYQCKNHYDDK